MQLLSRCQSSFGFVTLGVGNTRFEYKVEDASLCRSRAEFDSGEKISQIFIHIQLDLAEYFLFPSFPVDYCVVFILHSCVIPFMVCGSTAAVSGQGQSHSYFHFKHNIIRRVNMELQTNVCEATSQSLDSDATMPTHRKVGILVIYLISLSLKKEDEYNV